MRLAPLAVALAVFLSAGSIPAIAGNPDFTGAWRVDDQKSDDAEAKIDEVAGPDQVTSAGRTRLLPSMGQMSEPDRVAFREQLMALARASREMDITQDASRFEVAMGDQVRIHYFGREHVRQTASGQTLKCTLDWKGEQLLIDQKGDKGLRATELFTLLPEHAQLIHVVRIESKYLENPLEIKRIYNRVPSQ